MNLPFHIGTRPLLHDFGFVAVDMHSHLLPGIDDGAVDIDDTKQLLRGLRGYGIEHFWTTPHVMADMFGNDRASIVRSLGDTRAKLRAVGLGSTLYAAGEYYLDDGFAGLLERGELLLLPRGRVLVEWSLVARPHYVRGLLEAVLHRGYTPVIAHPERYGYTRGGLGVWRELTGLGCELQVNLLSLCGHYGSRARACAMGLLKARAVAYVGTDCHCLEHVRRLGDVLADREAAALLHQNTFMNWELALCL